MIRSSNRNAQSGFMLIEVLVTIAIVGLTIAPVFILQGNVLKVLYKISAQTRMLFPIQNELKSQAEEIAGREQEEFTEQKDIKIPDGKLTYKMRKVVPTSELKEIKDLYFTQVQMQLKRGDRESMVMFIYKPERKKKKT